MVEVKTNSAEETRAVGRRLAGLLRVGDVVLLCGRLGCGKTLFASGVAEGLGVAEPVVSPSFVLVREYDGFLPLVHADVYRLSSTGEFEDLELPELARDGILLIEWGHAVHQAMPADHLSVTFEITGEHSRLLQLVPRGTWVRRPLEEIVS